ncbi:sulfatase/phosphatase domain-containing protein [Clostridium pasteurianum]|uniref:sulfatase/phosphatase domain-containing protein n=1 Tax=Clostridium pasteurianum TaxID=1501 RepID=UPI0012BCE1CA|nr:sulfatase/phosphatase domain-containing protein [Clostridium pasteurianum]
MNLIIGQQQYLQREEGVILIDIPSTLLACADIKKPDDMQGKPLQQLVEGNNENWPKEIFVQISESQVGRAIRTKIWKYSVRAEGKNGSKDASSNCYTEDFLYDLENDYNEKNNLIKNPLYAEVRKQLADILKLRMKEANEKEPKIVSAL